MERLFSVTANGTRYLPHTRIDEHAAEAQAQEVIAQQRALGRRALALRMTPGQFCVTMLRTSCNR